MGASSRARGLVHGAGTLALAVGVAMVGSTAAAQTRPEAEARLWNASLESLSDLSIEQLGDIEITSVSRRPQPLAMAPSSVFVITGEDIRRSGFQTLPEALRLAPNLHVARIDALDYSITPRGFGGLESANKLLVLIDGRSTYSPLFSGVDWDQQHVLLDDLDRIEVISGPGGALWGANAVNGVINVTSRSSFDTQGVLVAGTAGTMDSDARLRYGGLVGSNGAYRVYATGYKRGDLETAAGANADDGWDGYQVGFRTDWRLGADGLTLQGDLHNNNIDRSLGLEGYVRGANLLGRWTRDLAGGRFEVQAYYDRVRREARLIYDALDTYDIQAQHSFTLGDRHQIVWGGGFRLGRDKFYPLTTPQLLDPGSRTISIGNVFAQDEVRLGADLSLIAGVKLEDSSYTGVEAMPNVRLAWRPSDDQLVWAAVSRAVRTPSRIERDFAIPNVVVPGYFDTEKLIAYEAGYRSLLFNRVSFSASVFYNAYDDLRTNDFAAPRTLPVHVGNTMTGRTWGAEVWGTMDVTDWWRLGVGAAYLQRDFKLKPGSLDIARFEAAGADPDGWVKVRSQFRLTDRLDLDLFGRAYDDVPVIFAPDYAGTPAYAELDARLAWRVLPALELWVKGSNLLHERHAEASESRRAEVPRSVHVGLRWTS